MKLSLAPILLASLDAHFLYFMQTILINKVEWNERWSPLGRPRPRHILKSLAFTSKVKFLALALKPQVLENWPVLGPRAAVFFELLKFCRSPEKKF